MIHEILIEKKVKQTIIIITTTIGIKKKKEIGHCQFGPILMNACQDVYRRACMYDYKDMI